MSSTVTTQHRCVRCQTWCATQLILWLWHLVVTYEDATAHARHTHTRQVIMCDVHTNEPKPKISKRYHSTLSMDMFLLWNLYFLYVLLQLHVLRRSWIWRRVISPHTKLSSLRPTPPTQIIPSLPLDAITHTPAGQVTTPVCSQSCPVVRPMMS